MGNPSKKKNSYIELLRFLMCIIILIHHSSFVADANTKFLFPLGSLAADFFFIVTGYFAFAHLLKREVSGNSITTMKYWMSYTVGKLKRVFPFAAVGIACIYVIQLFLSNGTLSIIDKIKLLQNLPFELSFTPLLGIMPVNLVDYRNAPLWFLSSMLIALPVLMYLISKYRDVFTSYVVWILPALVQSWMVFSYGGVCSWGQYTGLFYTGVIRSFSDMMMGCAVYIGARVLEERMKNSSNVKKVLLTIIELLLLMFAVFEFSRNLGPYDQILVLYIFEIMLMITMSGISYTSYVQGKVFDFLGKLSMPIYCMHWGIYQYVALFFPSLGYWPSIGLTFIACVVLAVLIMLILDRAEKRKRMKLV